MSGEELLKHEKLIHKFVSDNYNKHKKIFMSREDMFQELFLHLLEKIKNYDSDYKISTFLYLLMNNYCKSKYNYLSTQNSLYYNKNLPILDYLDYEQEEISLKEKIINKEQFESIKKHLSKEAVLYYLYELSYKEIGELLGINERAVRMRIVRNINKIRKEMNDNEKNYCKIRKNKRH